MKNIVLAAILSAGSMALAATPISLLPGVEATIVPAFDSAQTPLLPQTLYGEPVKVWRWLPQSDSIPGLATALQAEFAERAGLPVCQAINNEIFTLTPPADVQYDVDCNDQHVLLTIFVGGRP